jgi:hypothetical protein
MNKSLLEVAGRASTLLVAEVKTKSPFGFESHRSWDELFAIARLSGDIISIHVDERWGGSADDINRAKQALGEMLISPPILAKGTITGLLEFFNGCHQVILKGGKDHDGKVLEQLQCDVAQIVLKPETPAMLPPPNADPAKRTGGPQGTVNLSAV